jgi:CRP-like cAMP-binding protein
LGRWHDETVLALADTEVDATSKLAVLEAAKSDPALSLLLFAAAARAAMVAKEHSLMLLNRTTAEQVALFLLEMDVRLSKTWRDRFADAQTVYCRLSGTKD